MNRANFGNDPNYVYLANATAICNGQSVGYHDHPGTTVMQIGAATIAVTHWISNPDNEELVRHVLKDPLKFMNAIQNVLIGLNFLILLLLGFVALKKTGSVWVALLLQTTGFISANTLDHVWTKVAPEPFLFFIACLYVIAVLYFYEAKDKNNYKFVVVFALITGAGLATKATFFPLVILPLIILPEIKKKLFFIAGTIVSFVLFTIPAIPEYKYMYFWFKDLTDHTGKYGHGEKGFIDFSTYFPNILELLKNNPIFGFVTGFGIITLIIFYIQNAGKRRKSKNNWNIRILTALTATNLLGILLVAKHYIVHPNHYLIPVLLLTGILLFFILKILLKSQKIILPVIVTALIIFLVFRQPPIIKYADYGYKITNVELDSTQFMLEKEYADYTKIYYYPYSLNKYSALNFGDVYTKHKILYYLKELYPNTYFYNFIHGQFQYWNTEIFLEDIVEFNGDKILLIGGPRDEKTVKEMGNNGIPLKQIYKGRIETIYELDTLKYWNIAPTKKTEEIVFCDFETQTNDNQNFTGLNGETFGSTAPRTNEVARSGNHSIKMDKKTEFAVEYLMDSLKSGEFYEVEIWKKADNTSARLVVGSVKANVFYRAQNDFITSSEDGWDLLRVNFQVTSEMENTALKVYLWNKDKKQAYFDDLVINKITYKKPESETNKLKK
jgi:hypothetical protein